MEADRPQTAVRLQGFPNAWKFSRHKTAGLIRAARQAGACQLVIGSHHRSRWSRLPNGSTAADQVLRAAGDLPVHVDNVGRPDKTSDEWHRPGPDARQHRTA